MSRRRLAKSEGWRRTHEKDAQVRAARREGYRSRAAYKLLELDARLNLLFDGAKVADLGAAPGGWSQVAAAKVGKRGAVAAADLLPMPSLAGVQFFCGDVFSETTLVELSAALGGNADVVLSDMSPNLSGVAAADQAKMADLARAAADFALRILGGEGGLLMKVFHGDELAAARDYVGRRFDESRLLQARVSRSASREAYLFARRPKM